MKWFFYLLWRKKSRLLLWVMATKAWEPFLADSQEKPLGPPLRIITTDNRGYHAFWRQGGDKYHFSGDNRKDLVGFDVELARFIFDTLKIPLDIQFVGDDAQLAFLARGQADIALGLPKYNASEAVASFSKTPIFTRNYVFFGRLEDKSSLNLERMTYETALAHNFRIGIFVNQVYPASFWAQFPYEDRLLNPHLREGRNLETQIKRLRDFEIDLFLSDRERAQAYLKYAGSEEDIAAYKNILYWKDFYFAFSKNSSYPNIKEIQRKVEHILYKMHQENALWPLEQHWMREEFRSSQMSH